MKSPSWLRRLDGVAAVLLAACVFATGCPKPPTDAFRLGAILPLSGRSAQYGRFIQEGLELGVSEVNAAGGVRGRPLAILYEDDQATPNLAANAMKKLAEVDRVPIVFGSWASSSVLAQAPIAEKAKVIVMAEAVSPKIRDAGDFVFRIQPDGSYYMETLAKGAYEALGLRQVATIYVNNDFGIDLAARFRQSFEKLGGKIVSEDGFEQGTSDFRSHLTLLKGRSFDGVFVPAYTEIGHLLRQAQELGVKATFLAAATFENPDILEVAGPAAEGVLYPHHFDPDAQNPAVRRYQESYSKRWGHPSEGFAVLAYDGLQIAAKALGQCDRDTVCIRDFLYQLRGFEGVTGTTSFDEKGDIIKPIALKTVRSGRFGLFRK